jgi:L-threonylcarbamoyladenylate synthase
MHELDDKNLDIIIAEKFPEIGLGNSINDRLKRATFK